MSRGVLVVVSGFSGAGKGTVMKRLLEKYDNYALSISVTTRKPRPGEEDGREYFFRTKEEFEKFIEEDALIEYAQYVDNYYGTPRFYVEEQLAAGKDVILEIEIQGAMKVKEKNPEAVLVFVTPPTVEELKRRLTDRGTETPEVIAERLARASEGTITIICLLMMFWKTVWTSFTGSFRANMPVPGEIRNLFPRFRKSPDSLNKKWYFYY